MNNTAQLLEDSLLVIWNDRDAEARLKAMEKIYAAGIAFYESNDGAAIVGHEAINQLITKLQSQWPVEFSFELTGPGKVNHNVQHVAWRLGVPGQEAAATGMDIAVIQDEKVTALYLYLD